MSTKPQRPRWARRHPWLTGTLLTLLVVVAALAALVTTRGPFFFVSCDPESLLARELGHSTIVRGRDGAVIATIAPEQENRPVSLDRDRRTSAEAIEAAVRSAMARAREQGVTSIAFSALGTGVGGFPLDEAARIAVSTVRDELPRSASVERVIFALRGAAAPYPVVVDSIGRERAEELWRWTERELLALSESVTDALRPTGSLRLAADEEEREELAAEYEALRADGFAVEWSDELDPPPNVPL